MSLEEQAFHYYTTTTTGLGIPLTQDREGIYYRWRKTESLLEVDATLIHTASFKTCYLGTWSDATVFNTTLRHAKRRQLCIIRTSAATPGGFSISKTSFNDLQEFNSKLTFYLKELDWSAMDEETRVALDPSSIPGGILFLGNDTNEAFAVFVGYRKGEEWVHLCGRHRGWSVSEFTVSC
jgi:hypothetical protein